MHALSSRPFVASTASRSSKSAARVQAVSGTRDESVYRIYKIASATNRGRFASLEQKNEIENVVAGLQSINPNTVPVLGDPAPMDGKWQLVYSSCEVFRASPFFWAFSQGLVQNSEFSNAIFKFTDGLPIAEVKSVTQVVSLREESIVSRVVLEVWPGISGVVVTTTKAVPVPADGVQLTVTKTGIQDSNWFTFLDTVSVPVKDIIEYIRGAGAATVLYRTLYVDDEVRVSRSPDNELFIFVRVKGESY